MPPEVPADVSRLAPLPYHDAVVRYLQAQEPEVWQWAGSAQARQEHAHAVRSDLLKHTYRLDRDGHPELHARCDAAAQRLQLAVPVTLYQASEGGMNAALFHVPGEAHIVFTGAVLERLHRVMIECGDKHEVRAAADETRCLHARESGHVHIEKAHVRLQRLELFDRLASVARLRNDPGATSRPPSPLPLISAQLRCASRERGHLPKPARRDPVFERDELDAHRPASMLRW
jgi:hypothetical protein